MEENHNVRRLRESREHVSRIKGLNKSIRQAIKMLDSQLNDEQFFKLSEGEQFAVLRAIESGWHSTMATEDSVLFACGFSRGMYKEAEE
jgi:hypothetical protein